MDQALPPGEGERVDDQVDTNAAGNALRAAREAAGLSIDAVAQHLKLAPRQVAALENGDYAELPGRTFVRGFARNYARLMNLDADAVVAALPDPTAAPALERPTLGTSTRPMGAFEERPRRSARFAIPMLLIGLIGLGALYELNRSGRLHVFGLATPPSPATTEQGMAPPLPGATTTLPNPLAGGNAKGEQAGTAPGDTPGAPIESPAGGATLPAADALPSPGMAPPSPAAPTAATVAPAAASQATLSISYRAPSWTEVRDATGQRLLVGTMAAGSTQTVSGTPPFDVVLGNVSHTTVTWRGATVDTSAFHKQNVARLRLE